MLFVVVLLSTGVVGGLGEVEERERESSGEIFDGVFVFRFFFFFWFLVLAAVCLPADRFTYVGILIEQTIK